MSSILVVDDEKNIVQLVRMYLTNEGYQVETAYNGKEALDKARQIKPSLVILDLMMPQLDGLEVCKQLRREGDVPIIVLSARDDDVDRIVGLEVGADDYVCKPFNPRELVARVKAVLRRARPTDQTPQPLAIGNLRIDPARREVTVDGKPVVLRAKEFDLLHTFARHEGLVLDRERLLNLVWGFDYLGDSRTIDVHVTWLREKLTGSTCRIQTVWGIGYKLVNNEAG
ncbi:MAG TPA: response regulator transcription factor [Chloroflexota bacterium]|nr:response regulator transcription factor [Chloroflexota bacterium]